MKEELALSFELMGYGLIGVFAVLLSIIVLIKLLVLIFPHKPDNKNK